jgi:hypothetical protein
LARRIVSDLRLGMLCLADRAFVGYSLWRDAAATGADLLWRARGIAIFPCLECLDDGSYLSRLYPSPDHRRRERDGLTVWIIEYRMPGMPGQRLMLRSRRPDLILQKVYGLLLTHFAIRRLMYEASRQIACDPDTLSFKHTIEIVRRNLPFYAAFPP